jgi:hypothetical protein
LWPCGFCCSCDVTISGKPMADGSYSSGAI